MRQLPICFRKTHPRNAHYGFMMSLGAVFLTCFFQGMLSEGGKPSAVSRPEC